MNIQMFSKQFQKKKLCTDRNILCTENISNKFKTYFVYGQLYFVYGKPCFVYGKSYYVYGKNVNILLKNMFDFCCTSKQF